MKASLAARRLRTSGIERQRAIPSCLSVGADLWKSDLESRRSKVSLPHNHISNYSLIFMKWERSILISFLGNYLNNNVVAAVVALLPASASGGMLSMQYIAYVVLAAVAVGILSWWVGVRTVKAGVMFGVVGFVVAIVTAFVSGISGVLTQTGSLAQMISILPNFVPFIVNPSTLVLLGYWVIPAAAVGWYRGMKMRPASTPAPMSAPSTTM